MDPFKSLTFDDLGGKGDDEEQVELPEEDIDVGPDLGDQEDEMVDDEEMGGDEVDPIGDAAANEVGGIGMGDIPNEGDAGIKLDDPMAGMPGAPAAPLEPQVKWTNVPQDNGDIWSEHLDGYVLRARSLSAKNGDKIKYIAQLFKGKKLIEKGVVWLKQSGDAQMMLQNIADRILDKMGLVSHSLEQKPQEPAPAAPMPEDDSAPNEGDLPSGEPDEEGAGSIGDLDLGDEDLEALGG